MKTSHPAAIAACVLIACAGSGALSQLHAQQTTEPSMPIGALNAFPTIVHAGTHPVITWGIDYPQTITDIVNINPNGTLTTLEDVMVECRLVISTGQPTTVHNGSNDSGSSSSVYVTFDPGGTSLDVSSSKDLSNVVLEFSDGSHYKFDGLSGHEQTFQGIGPHAGKTISTVWVKSGTYSSDDGPGYGYRFDSPTHGSASVSIDVQFRASDSGSWNTVFLGSQSLVNPTRIEHTQAVRAYHDINVRSRMQTSSWLGWQSTGTGDSTTVVLKAGDTLPTSIPAFQRERIKNSLQPYINSSGMVSIGPKDILVLFELSETDPQAAGFDLQDAVLLLTFSNESKSAKVGSPEADYAPFATYQTNPDVDDDGLGSGSSPTLH